jgi:adenylate cyclase
VSTTILVISPRDIDEPSLARHLAALGASAVQIVHLPSAEGAEDLLLAQEAPVVVADAEADGVAQLAAAFRTEETFRLVRLLLLIGSPERARIRAAFADGADGWVARDAGPEVLAWHLLPLLRTAERERQQSEKISGLQEQSIHYYILSDLIRRYVPQTVWKIAQTYAHAQKLLIPEVELELTVVFGDIAGFTRMMQHLPPSEVIQILNSVFEVATRHVYDSGGDLDKFIGDAFLAVFEDPGAAVRSMLAVQRDVASWNRSREAAGKEPVRFRIGMHTGPVTRGNVGGGQRYDNTLIGDTVNIASRIEGLAEPGGILISERTRALAGLDLPPDSGATVELRGRDESLVVHRLRPQEP